MLVIHLFYTFVLLATFCWSQTQPTNVSMKLIERSELLRAIALSAPAKGDCSSTRYTFISEFAYGRSGNNLIEFTHTLWLSALLNRTLAVPDWMIPVLEPFSTQLLQSRYCYELHVDLKRSVYYKVCWSQLKFLFSLL